MTELDRIFTHEKRKPKLQRSTTRLTSPNSFRVYRGSPEDVAIQFRLETQYVTMNVPLPLAVEIGAHIKRVAGGTPTDKSDIVQAATAVLALIDSGTATEKSEAVAWLRKAVSFYS